MTLDPRRNLAATAAGILGIGLALLWVVDTGGPEPPGRIALLAAGILSVVAGAWPSRRVRFLLLVPAVVAFAIVGIVALGDPGFAIVLTSAVAAYGLFIEYAREGRD